MDALTSQNTTPPTDRLETATVPTTTEPRPHVVLISSPGPGHIIPMAQLANRFATDHSFAATLVTFTNFSPPAALSTVPPTVATATLPAVSLDDLPSGASIETIHLELVRRSIQHLRALLRSIMSSSAAPLAALVLDFFCSAALPLGAELGVPSYIFFPSNITLVWVVSRLVDLNHGAGHGELRGPPDQLHVPGCAPLGLADLPNGFRDPTDPVYAELLQEGRGYRRADGLLVNSFDEMEPVTLQAFNHASATAEEGRAFPPAYLVGPLFRLCTDDAGEEVCMEWLDRQPAQSVVYVCFGSGGTLSVEQTAELAIGLEMSGYRFLWVVRMPSHGDDGHDNNNDNLMKWLPQGFAERTKDRGLAVAAWVPQVRVLAHAATAGFVSHCGWNSTLESIMSGVPMIAWPLYAEQAMNAVMLEEVTGVALRVAERGDGLVGREEVAAVVRELLEGEKGGAVRRRAREMREAVARAWSPEGSSRRGLEEVAGKWKAALGKGNDLVHDSVVQTE